MKTQSTENTEDNKTRHNTTIGPICSAAVIFLWENNSLIRGSALEGPAYLNNYLEYDQKDSNSDAEGSNLVYNITTLIEPKIWLQNYI